MLLSPCSRTRRAITDPGPHIAVPFGKYLLIKRLAVGGMAELFLAQDEPEQPLVVIKRILPYLTDDPSFVQMFLDEARIAAQLHHPNVVRVHELGKLEDSIFIAMEYVEGVDLRKMLQEEQKENGAIPYAVAARIVAEVCAGLSYAHHCVGVDGRPMEIVHRDISPQNVMVGFDGRVKLVDFGIARANAFMERSKPGVLKGKFLYLSPEQVMQEPLDHRSDLFAIGTLLYEITTGKAPFQRPTPEAVIFAIRREDPPSPQLVRADYPPQLSAIVARCLTKDRTKRYQDASEIRADLEAFLASTRQVGAAEVAEYSQLLFGDEDERTILNIPHLQGTSQATLLVPPVLARPPSRKQESKVPAAPPPASGGTVNLRTSGEIPAVAEPMLTPADATPLFTPRPYIEPVPVTQPGRGPPREAAAASLVPIDERDTGELSISLSGRSAITESASAPMSRPGERVGVVEPLPPVIVSPPVPRRPTRLEQVAGAPAPRARLEDFTASFVPEATGSTTQALPPRRLGVRIALLALGAVCLFLFGAWIGRLRAPRPVLPPPSVPARGAPPAPGPSAAPDPEAAHGPAEGSAAVPGATAATGDPADQEEAEGASPAPDPAAAAGSSAASADAHDPSDERSASPPTGRVVFHLSRGAGVEILGRRAHSGVALTVPTGPVRYVVYCRRRAPVVRHLSVNPKSAKPLVISLRCPVKRAK